MACPNITKTEIGLQATVVPVCGVAEEKTMKVAANYLSQQAAQQPRPQAHTMVSGEMARGVLAGSLVRQFLSQHIVSNCLVLDANAVR